MSGSESKEESSGGAASTKSQPEIADQDTNEENTIPASEEVPQLAMDEVKNEGFNRYNLLSFLLLLAPLIMGFHISALFNEDTVLAYFSVKMGYATNKLKTIAKQRSAFPSSYASSVCLYPVGGLVGALSANFLVSALGRKKSTYVFTLSVILGSIFKFISIYTSYWLLILGRFFDGIGSSGIMVTALLLMFESMNDTHSKFAKPLVQVTINFGILSICCLLVPEIMGGVGVYAYSYLITTALGLVLGVVTFLLPESPNFIYTKFKDPAQTLEILKKLHGDNAPIYLQRIQTGSNDSNSSESTVTILGLFKTPEFRLAAISGIFINAAQQLSGINAVMAFCPSLLRAMSVGRPDLMSLMIIACGLLGSCIFAPMVSRFKRKTTLLIGFILMSVCLGLIVTLSNIKGVHNAAIIVFFGLFVAIFQVGPGPLVWFISIEIFPSNAVASAQSLGVIANWLSNAIVFVIPYSRFGINTLIVFLVFNIAISIYIAIFMAETYNRSSDEILQDYGRRSKFLCCS